MDVSRNFGLETLICSNNQLEDINLTKNTQLIFLSCHSNLLTKLDLKNNLKLIRLYCENNLFTSQALNALFESLNLTRVYGAKVIYIKSNPGSLACDNRIAENRGWIISDNSLITMTVEAPQATFSLYGSGPIHIDWGDNSEILKDSLQTGSQTFNHEYADAFPHTITIAGYVSTLLCSNTGCTMLDVSKNNWLIYISCSYNYLTNLNLRNNTMLRTLYCYNNDLSELDVRQNVNLTSLYCYSNQLTRLDLSANRQLETLYCNSNRLSDLNLNRNVELIRLYCNANQLTKLDVSSCIKLDNLFCENNQFSAEALNAIFESLHNNYAQNKRVNIAFNPGVDRCDISIAQNKGWSVY